MRFNIIKVKFKGIYKGFKGIIKCEFVFWGGYIWGRGVLEQVFEGCVEIGLYILDIELYK